MLPCSLGALWVLVEELPRFSGGRLGERSYRSVTSRVSRESLGFRRVSSDSVGLTTVPKGHVRHIWHDFHNPPLVMVVLMRKAPSGTTESPERQVCLGCRRALCVRPAAPGVGPCRMDTGDSPVSVRTPCNLCGQRKRAHLA